MASHKSIVVINMKDILDRLLIVKAHDKIFGMWWHLSSKNSDMDKL